MKRIPVSAPLIGVSECDCVMEALREKSISGNYGRFLPAFEEGFAKFTGSRYGVAVSSGTAALHVALAALEIRKGDEVLVSTLTNMATIFSVLYQGAIPVPVDIEEDTLNLDPDQLAGKVTRRTKAILPVHLFGHPVDMDPVLRVARRHGLHVVEDCAEAHGAEYKGRRVGGIGTVGCFSFYANKILTTGEGGMCVTSSRSLAEKIRGLKSLAFGRRNKFMHMAIGYNYRMTNLQAAIGYAQLGRIGEILVRKREIAALYSERLSGIKMLQLPVERGYAKNVYWMYHIVLQGRAAGRRRQVMDRLARQGIETREGFIPFNMQKIFLDSGMVRRDICPVANRIASRGMYLPSGPDLKEREINRITSALKSVLEEL